jgi:protein TonB
LLLISVVSTQRLALQQLRSILLPPTPPATVHNSPVEAGKSSFAGRPHVLTLNLQKFVFHPTTVSPAATAVAPAIGTSSNEGSPGAGFVGDILGTLPEGAPPPSSTKPKETPHPAGPMRLTSSVAAANLIYKVIPTYPPLAKTARVQGTIEFSAVIGKDGRIKNLQVVRGHPLLIAAATEAVLQWRYRPTLLNGVPVEVATQIVVNFRLGE